MPSQATRAPVPPPPLPLPFHAPASGSAATAIGAVSRAPDPATLRARGVGGTIVALGFLVVVAALLPWVSFAGLVSANGVDGGGDGWVTLLSGLIAMGCGGARLVAVPVGRLQIAWATAAISASGLCVTIAGADVFSILHVGLSLGAGLILTVVLALVMGGVALIDLLLLLREVSNSPATTAEPGWILGLGIASVLCVMPLGPAAALAGGLSLRREQGVQDPSARGRLIAGTACGLVGMLWLALFVVFLLVALSSPDYWTT